MKMNKITGIILAGGKSSRMGEDKGLILLNGKPMIKHIIDRLEELGLSIMIVANNSDYEQFNYPVFNDLMKEKGPLGGIYTGLFHSKTEANLILSCDTPNVTVELLQMIIDQSRETMVTIPEFNNRLHPLIGVYHRKAIELIHENLVNNQLKLIKVCEDLNAKIVNVPTELGKEIYFSNINTQQELQNLRR